MSKRVYGQYCGFARALEIVGERWALLLVRDLLVGPKRFSDLQRGLPGIPTNILTARLKELEQAGIAQRRVLPRPSSAVVYELTPIGKELEQAVYALGRWGAKLLGEPRADETVTADSLIMALRTTFRPKAARGAAISYELRFGDIAINARIVKGALTVERGPAPDPDLIVETGPAFKSLLARDITPAQAIKSGGVRLTGDRKLLDRFVDMFQI